jgi:PTS system cellobiose-specific IIA component
MKEELDIKSVKIATKVIMHAGNARALVTESINIANNGDLKTAESKLVQAKNEISSAHSTQTEVIQAEARGDRLEISLLLTHAQDTLMAAISEVTMAHHFLKLYERINSLSVE